MMCKSNGAVKREYVAFFYSQEYTYYESKTLREDRTAAETYYVAKEIRRRQRILQAGFFPNIQNELSGDRWNGIQTMY